jgi:hypothetical protein
MYVLRNMVLLNDIFLKFYDYVCMPVLHWLQLNRGQEHSPILSQI